MVVAPGTGGRSSMRLARLGRLLRGAVAVMVLASVAAAAAALPKRTAQDRVQDQPQGVAFLSQGWSVADRQWFYTATQGSQIMPYAWFMALERASDEAPFRD